jgi:peptide/nickel transport system substrate-binding protein
MKTVIGPGTGAYKFKRRVSQEVVEVERNPSYWKDGLPYMDELQFLEVDEAFTQVTGFQTGRFDWLRNVLSAELFRELQSGAGDEWTAKETAQTVVMNFIFEMKKGSPWRDNIELRQAMAKVLCQDDLREVLTDIGYLKWPGGALPLGFPYALTEDEVRTIPGYGRDCAGDRAEGTETLRKAGVAGMDFRIHTLGFFALMNDGAILTCEQLKTAGMGCSVNPLELGAYFDMGNNRRLSPNDLLAHSIVIRVPTIDGILSHAFHPDGPRNYGDYQDATLEAMYTAQSQETDPAKREQLVKDYQRYFLNQYYHVVLGWRSGSRAWWNYVNGPVATISSSEWWPLVMEDTWLNK